VRSKRVAREALAVTAAAPPRQRSTNAARTLAGSLEPRPVAGG
jgi:hypothetical protein